MKAERTNLETMLGGGRTPGSVGAKHPCFNIKANHTFKIPKKSQCLMSLWGSCWSSLWHSLMHGNDVRCHWTFKNIEFQVVRSFISQILSCTITALKAMLVISASFLVLSTFFYCSEIKDRNCFVDEGPDTRSGELL